MSAPVDGSGPSRSTGAPQVQDVLSPAPVRAREEIFSGRVWDVVRDTVDLAARAPGEHSSDAGGRAGTVVREYLRHPGAVGILALDDAGRVLLLSQYRHPVEHVLYELPAGLLDVPGEPPALAAARELAEEADLAAGTWHVLLDWFMSPGGSDEAFRLFLARDLRPVPEADRHERTEEEAGMLPVWLPLEAARDAVLSGRLHSPSAVAGILAASIARDGGWASLRAPDAPWPAHRAYR